MLMKRALHDEHLLIEISTDLNLLSLQCLQRKYPDATDFSICSLIGGFFFLRFINPAIVTPQAYMLVDGLPSKHPRRTLTLVRSRIPSLMEYHFLTKWPLDWPIDLANTLTLL